MPEGVAAVASMEGAAELLTLTTEIGSIGGIPAAGDFGMAYNAQAFVEQQAQFDWYDGGGLDQAFLGAAEVDCQRQCQRQQVQRTLRGLRRLHQHYPERKESCVLRHLHRGRSQDRDRKTAS